MTTYWKPSLTTPRSPAGSASHATRCLSRDCRRVLPGLATVLVRRSVSRSTPWYGRARPYHGVDRETERRTSTVAKPGNTRRQSLERHLVACDADPAGDRGVVSEGFQ